MHYMGHALDAQQDTNSFIVTEVPIQEAETK